MSTYQNARRVRLALNAATDAVDDLGLALGAEEPLDVARCAGRVRAAAERLIADAQEADADFQAAKRQNQERT